jgi:P2-related tail formation protein
MSDNILASGISQKEHLAVFDKIAALRFAALEVEKVLIYVIDTVDADALFYLAEQFDVLGYRGWKLAKTEADRRSLVKRAVQLHKYKGTPYGIKEALRSVGFDNTVIQEGINYLHDSTLDHNSVGTYGGNEWATFRVIYDLGNDKGISTEQTTDLAALVDEYKNVRSHLLGISWKASLSDNAIATEVFEIKMIVSQMVDDSVDGLDYNGAGDYNAANNHKRVSDILTVTEI